MRINAFVARASGLSRRAVDKAIKDQRIQINGQLAVIGQEIGLDDAVSLDGKPLIIAPVTTIMLSKPAGFVCSRDGQGSATIYDLLPPEYHRLKPVGRLDKNSSGLLLLTSDGQLANQLTHPRYSKSKVYEVTLDKPLTVNDKRKMGSGIKIDDYISNLKLSNIQNNSCLVTMSEGKNRQIRRTFAALDYEVIKLHRTKFGDYELGDLSFGMSIAC